MPRRKTIKPPLIQSKHRIDFSKEYLNTLFKYDNGFLYWKEKISWLGCVGNLVSPNTKTPHKQVRIYGFNYFIHRVIWTMLKGEIPKGYQIDHIDLNPSNNKIENLRLATYIQNGRNVGMRKSNTSGYIGVSLHRGKYWLAVIMVDKKSKYLGIFKTSELASEAYKEAAKKYFGEYARIN